MSALRGIHAASVPRRLAGEDQSRWSVCKAFNEPASRRSGAVPSPLAGPCGGMDAATEPPGTGSRRVPQAARAPRTRPTQRLIRTSDAFDLNFRRHQMVGVHGFQRTSQQTFWCGALAACGTVWRHGCRHRAPGTGSRRVPQAVRAPRPRPTQRLVWTSDAFDLNFRRHPPGCVRQNHCTHALSRYPLRKIAATTPRHTSRNRKVMPVLTAMCTSALP